MFPNLAIMGSPAPSVSLVDSNSYTNFSGNFSCDISTMTFSTGDIGIAIYSSQSYDSAYTVTAGWTKIGGQHNSSALNLDVYARTMDASDTTFASSGLAGGAESIHVVILSGASEPSSSNYAGADGTDDPPAVAISAVAGDFIISAAFADDSANDITSVPSGFTSLENTDPNGPGGPAELWSAYITGQTGSYNPGAFGGTAVGAAVTVIVQAA